MYGSTLARNFESLVIFLSDIKPEYILETKQMPELSVASNKYFYSIVVLIF